ncbi:MAG: tRNA (cytidine(34)-2'-O)-methyltransferase [Aquisalinus sp.]|nr:tRNA (cytidine(34)-2'-O)-methyltransferase [Aquisalinus sp.]
MHLALYQPEIARNVGAAIRIAACFGVTLHIIEPCGFPLKDKEIRKVAMDYGALSPPTYHTSWASFSNSVLRRTNRLILLSTKDARPIYEVGFQKDDILLMGQESAGVPDKVRNSCDICARIPLAENARSLNVSVAAGITIAEATRQLGI